MARGSAGLSDGVRGSTGVCGGGGRRWWRPRTRGAGAGELGSDLRFEGADRSQIRWLARRRGRRWCPAIAVGVCFGLRKMDSGDDLGSLFFCSLMTKMMKRVR
ncbi:hypothetical protein RJT34_12063 [Clitoria ternatea]|uniref:Uncharacterized protein n=1 Tax=Clitoria ternatea TaxID=43366 RepID=A0AAN9PL14_CLITE